MIEVIFWIDNAYDNDSGWERPGREEAFLAELKDLFGRVGWEISITQKSWPLARITKDEEWLDVYPLYICGTILTDSPKRISKLLTLAKTFHYRQIECLNISVGMSDSEYLVYLRSEREQMVQDILSMCCRKEEGTLLSSLVLYEWFARKYHIRRNGEVGEDVILQGVFRNLLDMLVVRGDLAEGRMDGEGIGYRTVRKEEQLRSENAA